MRRVNPGRLRPPFFIVLGGCRCSEAQSRGLQRPRRPRGAPARQTQQRAVAAEQPASAVAQARSMNFWSSGSLQRQPRGRRLRAASPSCGSKLAKTRCRCRDASAPSCRAAARGPTRRASPAWRASAWRRPRCAATARGTRGRAKTSQSSTVLVSSTMRRAGASGPALHARGLVCDSTLRI